MKKGFVGVVVCFVLLASLQAMAQDKAAHINFSGLIAQMPETKAADQSLKDFQKGIETKGDSLVKNLTTRYTKFLQDVESGGMAPVQQKQEEANLERLNNDIKNFEQQSQYDIEKKRFELMNPIIEKARTAVSDVAKTEGYKAVFDTSVFNSVLYAQETEDLMPKAKTKLGIQ